MICAREICLIHRFDVREEKTEPQLSLAPESFQSLFITLYPEKTVLNKNLARNLLGRNKPKLNAQIDCPYEAGLMVLMPLMGVALFKH